MLVEETTFYYEMTAPSQLRPSGKVPPAGELHLLRAHAPCPALNRFLYAAVGAGWYWVDRLPWPESRWLDVLSQPGYETWVAYHNGTPCGYFELASVATNNPSIFDTKIEYFGLMPDFHGMGLGGWLLTQCVHRAWAKSPERVIVNTSSLDHPAARKNYESRGFRPVRQETAAKVLPDIKPDIFGRFDVR